MRVRPHTFNRGVQSLEEFKEHREAMRKFNGSFRPWSAKRSAKSRTKSIKMAQQQVDNYADPSSGPSPIINGRTL